MQNINLDLNTSGMTGYVNTAATKRDYTASSNAQLVLGSVEYAHY